jgi:hypothetical protein
MKLHSLSHSSFAVRKEQEFSLFVALGRDALLEVFKSLTLGVQGCTHPKYLWIFYATQGCSNRYSTCQNRLCFLSDGNRDQDEETEVHEVTEGKRKTK